MSKYNFCLPHKVKKYIEYELEHFYENKKNLREIEESMISLNSPSLTFNGNGGEISKPTEKNAIKIASSLYIKKTDETIHKIEKVINGLDDLDKNLINLVYFRKTHTVTGAGMKVHLDKSAAYNHINKILGLIAIEMGLINCEEE